MSYMRLLRTSLFLLFALSCTGDDRFNQYVAESNERLTRLQEDIQAKWKTGQYDHFDWDQQTGIIAFSSGGKVQVIADIQFVGSISKKSGTWLWAWANSYDEEYLRRDVERVAEFGRKEHFSKLIEAKWPADEEDGWCMTAVAARVLDAEGAYRTEGSMVYSYMLLKNIRQAPPGYQPSHAGDRP